MLKAFLGCMAILKGTSYQHFLGAVDELWIWEEVKSPEFVAATISKDLLTRTTQATSNTGGSTKTESSPKKTLSPTPMFASKKLGR